jgi:hypothetical protein
VIIGRDVARFRYEKTPLFREEVGVRTVRAADCADARVALASIDSTT